MLRDGFLFFRDRRPEMYGQLLRMAEQVAPAGTTVLVEGETGTGKELIAKAIHLLSPRGSGPFVRVNCGALAENLLESELFGHVRGSFTGAVDNRTGRFEAAHTGTVFLDEINSTSGKLQVKLLRVLQEHEFERVGDTQTIRVDTRVIAASNRDLLEEVEAGRFREDLYYRLNVISLAIPPLRERPEDLPVLANHFIKKHAALVGDTEVTISAHALDELMRHNWPGNARELEHVLERALAFCGGNEIRPEHILPLARETGDSARMQGLELTEVGKLGLTETVADIERRLILMALRQCNDNQARAAQKLGIPRTTLRDKMAKYNIPVN